MELFPERDGNDSVPNLSGVFYEFVRMELFPERDGNAVAWWPTAETAEAGPNGALP